MKILISGATGYIGGNLTKSLVRDGHEVHTIVRPTTKTDALSKDVKIFMYSGNISELLSFMEKEKFDGLIHLAALYLGQHKPEDINNLIESNILFGTSLLEASVKTKVGWFINTSTFAQHFNDKEYSPTNLYAATKQAFEDLAKYYYESCDIKFVSIEIPETYGPHDPRPRLINKILAISKSGESLNISPEQKILDLNHIDDVVRAYTRMIYLLSDNKVESMNGKKFAITAKKRYTLRQIASVFERISGKALNINWSKNKYNPRDTLKPWDKGRKIPGWKPVVTLEEGIGKLYEQHITQHSRKKANQRLYPHL